MVNSGFAMHVLMERKEQFNRVFFFFFENLVHFEDDTIWS